MCVVVSNDYVGFVLKPFVTELLETMGHSVIGRRTNDDRPVDFSVMTQRVTGAALPRMTSGTA